MAHTHAVAATAPDKVPTMPAVSSADFDYIAGVLKRSSGLSIGPDKAYLLESRLVPVAKRHGMTGLDELILELRAGKIDRKSTRLNSSHSQQSRMPSSA